MVVILATLMVSLLRLLNSIGVDVSFGIQLGSLIMLFSDSFHESDPVHNHHMKNMTSCLQDYFPLITLILCCLAYSHSLIISCFEFILNGPVTPVESVLLCI